MRSEFVPWVRSNIRAYQTAPLSTNHSSVLELISQQGCEGAGFLQLEAGLAKVIDVALPQVEAPQETQAGVIPDDSAAFIASCYPLHRQAMIAKGYSVGERGVAFVCLCQEHAARVLGDAKLYASLKVQDDSYYTAHPELHDDFIASFDQCFRSSDGSEFRARADALWREMNI